YQGYKLRKSDITRHYAEKTKISAIGEQKVIVILIDFRDVIHNRDKEFFEDLIFSHTNPWSLYSYYKQASNGNIEISGTVLGWYNSSQDMVYYGKDGDSLDNANGDKSSLAREALLLASKDGFDFSEYDKNEDGKLDHIIIVHAGPSQEKDNEPYGTDCIWSHYGEIRPPQFIGKLRAEKYCMISEYSPIGVIAHEFGHSLGLPDLYDNTFVSNGIGIWGVMGYGAWLMGGRYPSLPCAWSKVFLGWVKPDLITKDERVLLDNEHKQIVKVPIDENEYFLLENRRRIGFDEYIPEEGLLIWHIDDSVGCIDANDVNSDVSHKRVDLEEADGYFDLDKKINYGDTGDIYNHGTSFSPYTIPNSYSYSVKNTGIAIENIKITEKTIEFDVRFGNISLFIGDIVSDNGEIPIQNFPNPFNPDTWIPYRLQEDSNVLIKIYSASGQLVRTLDLGYKTAGSYISKSDAAYWDGKNESGDEVSSGVYFYHLQTGKSVLIKKMTIIK
ncbi:MAG: M6 family metalloprotease domain-containing protein, partial [bacterium]